MTEFEFNCNVSEAYQYNTELTTKEVGKSLKKGMKKAMSLLVKDAKSNLRKSFNNVSKKNPKYNDTLISGVRSSKVYEDKKDGSVYAFGKISRRKNSGSGVFRLLFLEQGTIPNRQLRKNGANRGGITGKWFFKKAVDSNESKFNRNMIESINQAIEKINSAK